MGTDWAYQNRSLRVGWLPKEHPEYVRFEQPHWYVSAWDCEGVEHCIPVLTEKFARDLILEFDAMNAHGEENGFHTQWEHIYIRHDVGLFNR